MGAVNVTTQVIWLQHFLIELGVHFHHSIVLWCDNKINIKLCRDPIQNKWTKHIEVHMHFIQGEIRDGVIVM
jgi:hypothetical protein